MSGGRTRYNASWPSGPRPEPSTALLTTDSSPAAERLQIDLWRRMSAVDKAAAVSRLTRATQELSLAGIRLRHPGAPERECLLRLAALKLGRDLARRAYPEVATLLDA